MKVNYLGPACLIEHPALADMMASQLPPSCYLVEVSDEAGVEGPVIEGDVLVVDEERPVQHADLVVVEVESQFRLYKSHRVGGRCRLVPASGVRGHFAQPQACRGVVVDQLRTPATA
jgi:DNA polymerase V